MENYIMLEGNKIPLTDEQVKMLRDSKKPEKIENSQFEKVDSNSKYFYIDDCGIVEEENVNCYLEDQYRHKVANYCTDKSLMIQRALHETLNRLLWRFSMENGEGENLWNCCNTHYEIYWSYDLASFNISCNVTVKSPTSIYFPTKEIANKAIDEIVIPFMEANPDFVY